MHILFKIMLTVTYTTAVTKHGLLEGCQKFSNPKFGAV